MKTERATFAAGCFWHVQDTFDCLGQGILKTTVGYIKSQSEETKENKLSPPDYHTAEKKGYAEAIEIEFDPTQITYIKLLKAFWKDIDPTSLNKQRNDVGKRYRSEIFFHNEKQKQEAEKSKKGLQKTMKKQIVTNISPAGTFYPAEEHHQKYNQKHGISKCP